MVDDKKTIGQEAEPEDCADLDEMFTDEDESRENDTSPSADTATDLLGILAEVRKSLGDEETDAEREEHERLMELLDKAEATVRKMDERDKKKN
jgi:hypothetical protein